MSTWPVYYEIIICSVLVVSGILFGMDKGHNIFDWVGPACIAAGMIYAFWLGWTIPACFMLVVLLFKIFVR